MPTIQLRDIEKGKIHYAREHFKAISNDNVVYDVVDSLSPRTNPPKTALSHSLFVGEELAPPGKSKL